MTIDISLSYYLQQLTSSLLAVAFLTSFGSSMLYGYNLAVVNSPAVVRHTRTHMPIYTHAHNYFEMWQILIILYCIYHDSLLWQIYRQAPSMLIFVCLSNIFNLCMLWHCFDLEGRILILFPQQHRNLVWSVSLLYQLLSGLVCPLHTGRVGVGGCSCVVFQPCMHHFVFGVSSVKASMRALAGLAECQYNATLWHLLQLTEKPTHNPGSIFSVKEHSLKIHIHTHKNSHWSHWFTKIHIDHIDIDVWKYVWNKVDHFCSSAFVY